MRWGNEVPWRTVGNRTRWGNEARWGTGRGGGGGNGDRGTVANGDNKGAVGNRVRGLGGERDAVENETR